MNKCKTVLVKIIVVNDDDGYVIYFFWYGDIIWFILLNLA